MNKNNQYNRYTNNPDNDFYYQMKRQINDVDVMRNIELDLLIDFADKFAEKFLKNVKTHQIRRFFSSVKSIEKKVRSSDSVLSDSERVKLIMLRPQLANASAKQKQLKKLTEICTIMIQKVDEKPDFERFANFFESLVAFHKVYAKE
ncbi:type III-A CRISPR-associated protein Csm2 [candidate division KSB1 bacterium]|nr:type III-A CRISPR-associated protein Csm2 [candidate division KSB1 bacterium]